MLAAGGVMASSRRSLSRTTRVEALAPKLTVTLAPKPVPLMVTSVPPTTGPLPGLTEVTMGAGTPPSGAGASGQAKKNSAGSTSSRFMSVILSRRRRSVRR